MVCLQKIKFDISVENLRLICIEREELAKEGEEDFFKWKPKTYLPINILLETHHKHRGYLFLLEDNKRIGILNYGYLPEINAVEICVAEVIYSK